MAIYSTTMRYTGLSGVDTESMVQQLMKAESVKYDRLKQQQQLVLWKQEAYRGVGTSLKTFQNSFLSLTANNSLRLGSTFAAKLSTVKQNGSDSSAATVTSSTNAATGSYALKIEQLASKDVRSSKSNPGAVTGKKADEIELLLAEGEKFAFDVSLDGTKKRISFSEEDLERIEAAGMPSDDPAIVQTEEELKKAKSNMLVTVLNEKLESAFSSSDGIDRVKASIDESTGQLKFDMPTGKHTLTFNNVSEDQDWLDQLGIAEGASSGNIATSKSLADVFGIDPSYSTTFSINGTEFSFTGEDTIDAVMKAVNGNATAGVKMTYDSFAGFKLESKTEGAAGAMTIVEGESSVVGKDGYLSLDGAPSLLSGLFKLEVSDDKNTAKDAIYTFNNVRTFSNTNNIEVSGLKMTLNATTTEDSPITISVSNDTSQVKETIMKFVEEYNNMISGMNDSVTQKKAKKSNYDYYEPLSEEQKSGMKEKDIENWEAKAKEGLLYRDEILSSITSSMRSYLYEPVDLGNGKSISLYEIGIQTSSLMKDRGKLVVDESKLDEALTSRLDDIEQLFTKSSSIAATNTGKRDERMKTEGISERLNDIINDAIGSNGRLTNRAGSADGVSDLTNAMTQDIKRQDEELRIMLEALVTKENNYYLTFSKMEAAMNSANSQMSYLTAQLGM